MELLVSVCWIDVPIFCPVASLSDSPVTSGLSVTVQVYRMPLVVVLLLVTGISVVPPLQIVSPVAARVTVGSTQTSILMGVPGQLLLPCSFTGQGVIVYVSLWATALLLVSVCWIDVP